MATQDSDSVDRLLEQLSTDEVLALIELQRGEHVAARVRAAVKWFESRESNAVH